MATLETSCTQQDGHNCSSGVFDAQREVSSRKLHEYSCATGSYRTAPREKAEGAWRVGWYDGALRAVGLRAVLALQFSFEVFRLATSRVLRG